MICEFCAGTGYLPDEHPPRPCPGCSGVGYLTHIASPDCWCRPVQDDEPGVLVHHDVSRETRMRPT